MHLQMVGPQLIDEAALANIGNANHKQSAVWTLCSMPPKKLSLIQKIIFRSRPVLSTNKFGGCWNDGCGLRAVEGLAVGEQDPRDVGALSHRLPSDGFLIRLWDQIRLVQDQQVRSGSPNHISESKVPPTERDSCVMHLHVLNHERLTRNERKENTSKTQSTSLIFLCMDLRPLWSDDEDV